ncbi:C-type lectin domain family 4 member M CD209 antigen-like protein 1 [Triplophysa tibetana]|uniref:C-type lectin domain family 4 member M CD209 antigen-like protein 1 n=1 Tax=Triplophysa tibetana TaxID=1572043 RepID=A0A5A9N244_9TELE|nr:C-type lectin domain family 4 member M CD209 antigen-like protein 1 [Triplophysa tibetana]
MSGIIYNNVNATEVLDKGIYENLDSIWNREVNTERQQQIDWSSDYFKWIYYNFSFYYISSELKTWNYSREDCKERGGDLVIIKSKEQQEFIQNATAGYGFDPFWIGLRKEEGLWKWIDEITLTTSFWIDGYPRSNNRYCARTSSSGWSDFSCDDVYGWIYTQTYCKSLEVFDLPEGVNPETVSCFMTDDRSSDNFKWVYYNFRFYYILSEMKSWSKSRRDCHQRGADLVIINMKEKRVIEK